MRITSTMILLVLSSIVANAGSPESCIQILRVAAYDESTVKQFKNVNDAMRYAFCNSEIKNRSDAEKQGFHLGVTIYDVPIGIDNTVDNASMQQWKNENCGSGAQAFNKTAESEILKKVVSPEVSHMFDSRIRSKGLFCSIGSPSPETVLLNLDFDVPPGSTKTYATVRNATVTNATSLDPGAKRGQAIGAERRIYVGGRIIILNRRDIRQTVTVAVDTDFGTCPQPLVVPGGDMTAKATIKGTAEKRSDKSERVPIELANSSCSPQQQIKRICLSGGDASLKRF
jgi:hypothetical protein